MPEMEHVLSSAASHCARISVIRAAQPVSKSAADSISQGRISHPSADRLYLKVRFSVIFLSILKLWVIWTQCDNELAFNRWFWRRALGRDRGEARRWVHDLQPDAGS